MAAKRKCLSTDDEFRLVLAASLSIRQVLSHIGPVPAGGNHKTVHGRIQRLELDTSYFTGAGWNVGERYRAINPVLTLTEVMVENSTYNFTHGLKKRLIKEGIKSRNCEGCGLSQWRGELMPLELHHVNGINNNHRLANLQLLCPNCHALTENYRGKNQNRSKV